MSDLQRYAQVFVDEFAPRVRTRGYMTYFVVACVFWALSWLLYRAYQVITTPNEILVDKLGLDIPPAPEISLEEIEAKKIRISWKLPDTHHSIHKHVVQVNGVKVGECKRSETAAIICNLSPNTIYSICVLAVSVARIHTSSQLLHVCTKHASSNQSAESHGHDQIEIRPYVAVTAGPYIPNPAPAMTREHSGSQSGGKRPGPHRKHSPAVPYTNQDTGAEDASRLPGTDEADEPLEHLAERLKTLQAENDAVERQILQEEEEFKQMTAELEQARDESKNRVKERNEASGDLRKQVTALENNNRSAQNEKNKKERLLQQKESEYKKRTDDITRWEEQIQQMKDEIARIEKKKAQAQDDAARRVSDIDNKILEQQLENKTVEENLRVNGLKIKELEEERQKLVGGDDSEEVLEAERLEQEKDKEWELKMNSLRARYASMMGTFNQAQTQYHEAQKRLDQLNSRQSTAPGSQVNIPSLELDFSRKGSKRRTRHRNSLASNVSSPPNGFAVPDTSYQNQNYSSGQGVSPTFAASSAIFNMNNGMVITGPEHGEPSSDSDLPSVVTPMSPRADALLPSDLLGDEEPMPYDNSAIQGPTSPVQFSGLGSSVLPFEMPRRDSSPVSSGSRSASIFSSPRESLNNLQLGSMDPDRRSLHRTNEDADAAQTASRRLSGFFGFNRQRGKTLADGPMLGTLKQGQSQSFPRDLDEGLGPVGARRRRLSYTGNWPNVANLFPRSHTPGEPTGVPSTRRTGLQHLFNNNRSNPGFPMPGRASTDSSEVKKGYNQFSPRHDPIDPSILLAPRGDSSPRLTGFSDNQLPKPGFDGQMFGWNAHDHTSMRASPLGVDWSSPQAWSRNVSRRPSASYGSNTNLSLVPSGESNFLDGPHEPQRPLQAPIGTRPTSSQRPVTPKLNPAAPSFRGVFSRRPDTADSKLERDFEGMSPPRRSMSNSVAESYDSLELVNSGTASSTDAAGTGRETFIQRITRKGSSSQFKIPWKDRALFSKKGGDASATPAEGDEEAWVESQLGKSVGSVSSLPNSEIFKEKEKERDGKGSKPSSLSFSFMRKARRAAEKGESGEGAEDDVATPSAEEV